MVDVPVLRLPLVYHVGSLDPSRRGELHRTSQEGPCLSVSLCPGSWAEIARLGGSVQEHPSQPGYRTHPGHVFRRDGYDALVFADDMNLYAYAFPSPPDVVARPDEQETYAPRM